MTINVTSDATPTASVLSTTPDSGVAYWLKVAVLTSDALLMALVFTVLPPALPSIGQHFDGTGHGRWVAQFIMTMPSIGLMVGGLITGWLVDYFNPRRILAIGLLSFAVFGSAGLYVDTAGILLASRFFLGITSACVTTAAAWLLGALFAPSARAQLLGYRNALGSLGGVLSTFLAGPLTEAMGWRAPFSFYLLAVAILVLAMAVVPRSVPQSSSTAAVKGRGSLRTLWPIYVAAVPVAALMFATVTQVSFLLTDEGHTSPTVQAWVIGMGSVTSMIGAMIYGLVRRRCGSQLTFALLVGCMGLGNIILGFSQSPGVATLGTALAGFGSGAATPYFCNLVLDQANIELRGRALGFLYSTMFFGDFLNPVIFNSLTLRFSLNHTFLLVGLVVTAAAVVLGVMRSRSVEITN